MSPPNVPSGDNTDDVTGGVGEPEFYDLENEDSYLTAFDKTEQRRRHKYEKRHRRHHQKRVTSSKPQMVPFGARLMDKSSVLNQVQEHNYKLSTVTHSMHQIIRDLRPEHTSHARENAKTPQSKTPRHEMSSKQNVDCVDACKSMTNSARQRQRQTAGVPTDEHAFVDDSAMRTRKEKELERRPYISLVTRAPLSSVNNGVTKQPCDKQIFRTRVQNDVNVSQTKKHATMHASLPSSRHELLVDGRRDNGEYLEPVSSKDRTGVSPSHAQRANGLSTAHRPLPARQGLRRFASETHLNASQHARGEDTPWGCSLRDIQHNTNEASMVSLQSVDSTKSTLTYYGSMMNLSSYENLHRKSSSGMIITDDGLGIERSKTPYGQKTDCSLNSNEGGQSTFSSDSGFHQEYDLGEYLAEEPIYETIRDDDVISYDGGHMTVKPTPPKLPSRNGILKRAVSELSLIDHNAAMPCKDGNFIRFSNDEKSRSRLSLRKLKHSFRTSRVMGRLFKNGAKEQTTNNVSNAHASIPNSQKGAGTSTRNPGIPQCHNTSVSTVVPKENPKEQAKVEQTTPNNRCAPSHREYNNNEKRENGVNLSPKSRDNLYNLLKDKDTRLFFSESLAQERKLRDSPPLNNERYVKSVGLGTIRSSNLNSNFLAFRVPDRVNIMSRSVYC
ncbi:uncharacterized protein LOC106162384 [Lingula anatina]|uniref:Uncharacterized protein LOC106162384 n=1 Tax=Lingula anatina TaxID=7574 RepID=A0A1S3IA37_LINAN|nr:uncharacterized protein LOC106162384 [Lingula anatina]XP_013395124.1 uncharacterized protein LOC106162384 [Lingula anatina]XP_013395125.1 uncharacterized protein LOC106162384 [Lingula anatina]XP_013395126.1 uncharacterized protein LOC106162384 [Lingula anatina]XP_013395127.1 uncharacterized protein LOC106162384 [Lingula anatina]|eukprot:XP_013395123.1 uncharacterized protein LOC106162384 [Lingula anatina]